MKEIPRNFFLKLRNNMFEVFKIFRGIIRTNSQRQDRLLMWWDELCNKIKKPFRKFVRWSIDFNVLFWQTGFQRKPVGEYFNTTNFRTSNSYFCLIWNVLCYDNMTNRTDYSTHNPGAVFHPCHTPFLETTVSSVSLP